MSEYGIIPGLRPVRVAAGSLSDASKVRHAVATLEFVERSLREGIPARPGGKRRVALRDRDALVLASVAVALERLR